MNRTIYLPLVVAVLFASFCFSCSSQSPEEKSTPMIVVGNKTIDKTEFIRRAEYTIRPPFCKGNGPLEKKIILNSLVAEKLLALEAGQDNELTNNPEFQSYLTGRKEQAMRQYFYYDRAYHPVSLPDSVITRAFKLASLHYKINYLTITDSQKVNLLSRETKKANFSLQTFFHTVSGKDSIPTRDVGYFDADLHPLLAKEIYSKPLKKGAVVGPIKTGEKQYVVIQVDAVRERIDMEPTSRKQTLLDIKEKLTNQYAAELYEREVKSIMSGKSLNFNPNIFKKVVKLMGPQYLKSEKEFKKEFKEKFWQKDAEREALDAIGEGLDNLADQEFFNFNGEIWTVKHFEDELSKHPLVFREKHFNKRNFAEQFKLAIVDMVRDREICKVCYEGGYDQIAMVKHNYEMWKDNLLSLYQKNNYLKDQDITDLKKGDIYKKVLNPYIRKLQKKYSDRIFIDIEKFDDIKLTRIDMMALQQNVPFPIMVPGFPQLIDDHRMDYGRKMEKNNYKTEVEQ